MVFSGNIFVWTLVVLSIVGLGFWAGFMAGRKYEQDNQTKVS